MLKQSCSYSMLKCIIFYKINTLFKTKPSVKSALGVSIVLALITLIRPVNGILYLLIPFYGVASLRDFKDRMAWIIGNKLHFFLPITLLLVFYHRCIIGIICRANGCSIPTHCCTNSRSIGQIRTCRTFSFPFIMAFLFIRR